jgi:hypothetical protein
MNYQGTTPAPNEFYANNISYANEVSNFKDESNVVNGWLGSNNSWEAATGVTVTAADFLSLDTAELRYPRQADFSLPDINFGKLASTSDLIDKGVDIGLAYSGTAPDLGYIEYADSDAEPVTIYTSSVTVGTTTATTGGNTIDDGGGTVTEKGVAWGSGANPTIAGSHTSDGTGTGNFISNISGLTPATTYHVRAYATNEYGTGYGADVEFTTNSESGLSGDFVFSGGKPVYSNGKQVIK